jgi:hypothetical protein
LAGRDLTAPGINVDEGRCGDAGQMENPLDQGMLPILGIAQIPRN